MASLFQRVFRVYPEEWRLLIWVTLIQLAMRVSSVLVNNYSQSAFLKRFGVEHLPTVFLIESILTFLVINAVGVLMGKYRTLSVFTGLLVFFGVCVGAIRLMIPLDLPLLYPILFILKSQAIGTLPILYWDILNDMFTTRQSKRLFTLITAGGILGTTLGSVLTGNVARWVGVDNVLWVFVVGTFLAAALNQGTERVLGAPLQTRTDKRRKKAKPKLSETLRGASKFWKESPFLRYTGSSCGDTQYGSSHTYLPVQRGGGPHLRDRAGYPSFSGAFSRHLQCFHLRFPSFLGKASKPLGSPHQPSVSPHQLSAGLWSLDAAFRYSFSHVRQVQYRGAQDHP